MFGGGHSALNAQDVVYRAGGLILANPLIAPGNDLSVRPITTSSAVEKLPELAAPVLDGAGVRAGDALVVLSLRAATACRSNWPGSAATAARWSSVSPSVAASTAEPSRHPSGTRLLDNCDVVLDAGVPVGDAALAVDGVPQKVGPTSGVVCSALMQALMVSVIGRMVALGVEPPVFMSANVAGGAEWNDRHAGGARRPGVLSPLTKTTPAAPRQPRARACHWVPWSPCLES
ncbi:sugar isomerase domain-containing protein [Yinghuangia aomiensis]